MAGMKVDPAAHAVRCEDQRHRVVVVADEAEVGHLRGPGLPNRQAVARGYIAVCIEQLCFGERRELALTPRSADPCVDAFHHALLTGRTLLGERMSDVSAVIDWLTGDEHGFAVGDIYAIDALGVSGYPTLFVIGADGKIVWNDELGGDLQNAIDQALAAGSTR